MGWLNLTMATQTVKNDLKAKKVTLPQFFILQNFKIILRTDPEFWWCAIFGSRMAHLFWTNAITFIYVLAIFIGQNSSCGSRVIWMDNFGPKIAHFPKWEFFSENLLIILFSFILAYLHAKNQSQILIYNWNVDD